MIVRVEHGSDFDQDVMFEVLIKGIDCLFVHLSNHFHRSKVHVLDGLHDIWQLSFGGLQHLEHRLEVLARDNGNVAGFG